MNDIELDPTDKTPKQKIIAQLREASDGVLSVLDDKKHTDDQLGAALSRLIDGLKAYLATPD